MSSDDNNQAESPNPGFVWALLQFSGRMNREEYWWANGCLFGGSLLAFYVTIGRFVELTKDGQAIFPDHWINSYSIIMIVSVIVTFAISTKRLHDLGWSGRFSILLLFPFVGILFFLLLGLLKGEPKTNRFGPPPPSL